MNFNDALWNGAGRRIHMQEVGTRDGLQVEEAFVPTEDKIALVNALSQAGMAKIEVTAFVSPKAIPALRDAEIVLREIERSPGVVYSALVPNVRGAERAIDANADELNLVMSASESHNLANLRMTRAQSFAALSEVNALARQAKVPVNVSLSCAFGCPMEGDVPVSTVLDWCHRFIEDMGARGVTLCDTTGMAYPGQVAALTAAFRERWPCTELTLHFHNTRGMGLANVIAAIDAGADRFDASLGGIGGCPYAPGATGNVCSEEIVHALELMGYRTGVDLPLLIEASKRLPALIGHDIPSQIVKAGRRLDLHPVPADFAAIRERAIARAI
ncbi:hydroxymethylglutaryl-CoA lyase [Variovorax sp. GT1P44]|uniref:hydroxymethylglutaryl-CoA lyase n=1 Tax=Variovorax sp. GT1P44 TaxID=3443742 RepID=UPI003F465077